MRENPPEKRFLVGCSSSRKRLAGHLTFCFALGASTMSPWSVKTRRAPPHHCRDARVYGHSTTAMHDIEYTPPPVSPTGQTSAPILLRCFVCWYPGSLLYVTPRDTSYVRRRFFGGVGGGWGGGGQTLRNYCSVRKFMDRFGTNINIPTRPGNFGTEWHGTINKTLYYRKRRCPTFS